MAREKEIWAALISIAAKESIYWITSVSLYEAHRHSVLLEQKLRERFGAATLITIHLEPLKANGNYLPD